MGLFIIRNSYKANSLMELPRHDYNNMTRNSDYEPTSSQSPRKAISAKQHNEQSINHCYQIDTN